MPELLEWIKAWDPSSTLQVFPWFPEHHTTTLCSSLLAGRWLLLSRTIPTFPSPCTWIQPGHGKHSWSSTAGAAHPEPTPRSSSSSPSATTTAGEASPGSQNGVKPTQNGVKNTPEWGKHTQNGAGCHQNGVKPAQIRVKAPTSPFLLDSGSDRKLTNQCSASVAQLSHKLSPPLHGFLVQNSNCLSHTSPTPILIPALSGDHQDSKVEFQQQLLLLGCSCCSPEPGRREPQRFLQLLA